MTIGKNGYANSTRQTGTPRDIEYQVLLRITGRLSHVRTGRCAFPEMVEALDENLRFWRTVAIDVHDDDNSLPVQLRAQLFYLFEFTHVHSPKVMRGEADISALIDINKAVLAGLKGSVSATEVESCPA